MASDYSMISSSLYLSSIRCAVSTTGIGSERGDYYPDGTLISDLSWPGSYKYNGKEFDNLYRLNWLDYGARQYMPDLAQWASVDPLCEKYYHLSPYAYCANNPVNAVDPDGRSIYMLFYSIGNGNSDDNMFYSAAETRMKDIMGSRGFNPNNDIVVMRPISDIGSLGTMIENIINTYSDKYGNTAELGIWSHSGLDGPIGTTPTSSHALEGYQMDLKGGGNINFNWNSNASAFFYGCRSREF